MAWLSLALVAAAIGGIVVIGVIVLYLTRGHGQANLMDSENRRDNGEV